MLRIKTDWPTLFLFLTVVACSTAFRITNLDLIEFKGDEAINLYLAARPLFGHPFPPGGTVSSIGLLNPPLFNYLLFPLVAISTDPKVVSLFIGLINSLAVGFFFLVIQRFFGRLEALLAGLLLALSPWAILFSRKIWTQDLIIPFFILLLFSLYKIILEKKMIYWTTYVIASLFLIQLHQSIIILLMIINVFLLFKKIKLHFTYIFLGFLLGIIPAIPYLVYVISHVSSIPQAFLVSKGRFSQEYFPAIFFRLLQITNQGNFRFILGDDTLTFANNFPLVDFFRRFLYFEYLLLPFGALVFWKKFPRFRFLVYATLGLPTVYFFLHFQPFMHYLIALLPLLFLFLATGLAFLLRFNSRIIRTISLLILIVLIGVSVAFNQAFFQLLDQQKSFKGDYGISFTTIESSVKKQLQPYQNDPNYQEMFLVSFIPKNIIYGYLPVARMIYPYEKTQAHLSLLEERLKQVPDDPRVLNELIAFYTASKPIRETVKLLERKSNDLPGYRPVYEEIHKLFLEQNP